MTAVLITLVTVPFQDVPLLGTTDITLSRPEAGLITILAGAFVAIGGYFLQKRMARNTAALEARAAVRDELTEANAAWEKMVAVFSAEVASLKVELRDAREQERQCERDKIELRQRIDTQQDEIRSLQWELTRLRKN